MIFLSFEEIMWLLVIYLIVLLIMAIFLSIALSFFSKAQHTNFGNVFLTAFLITIVYAVVFYFLEGSLALVGWLIVLILTWIIISVSHNVGFLSAIVITVLAFLLYVLVVLLLNFLLPITIDLFPF
ncbi:MAG: hypothetical protein ACFFCV_21700 [Promethearchaeota archaeon]